MAVIRIVALALAAAGIATAPAGEGAATVAVRDSVLGRSVEGRPIRLARIGERGAPVRVLVVGAIHGSEPAGLAVTAALRRRPAPRGVELWVIEDLNPDGNAAGTRQNAHGVDLNRNFPTRWRAHGRPFDAYYSGPRPLSEPESRLLARLVRRLRPAATVWYHQALALVDLGTAEQRLVRRYARASGLPARRLGFLPGVATRWQNRLSPGTSAFVVELPAGPLGTRGAARHARAVHAVAAYAGPLAGPAGRHLLLPDQMRTAAPAFGRGGPPEPHLTSQLVRGLALSGARPGRQAGAPVRRRPRPGAGGAHDGPQVAVIRSGFAPRRRRGRRRCAAGRPRGWRPAPRGRRAAPRGPRRPVGSRCS